MCQTTAKYTMGPKVILSKVTPDIEDFTDEREVQVVKNAFADDSKK